MTEVNSESRLAMHFPADFVQGVAFLDPAVRPDEALKLWHRLFEDDGPDGFQRDTNTPNLQTLASGERNGYANALSVQVGRIDFTISVSGRQPLPYSPDPVRINDVGSAVANVTEQLRRIAGFYKPIRLALVVDTARNVQMDEQTPVMVDELAPLALPHTATDIMFQMNVRKPSVSQQGLQINRLCVWGSGQAGIIPFPQGQRVSMSMNLVPFIGLKIDVNTAPEQRVMPENATDIVGELASEAMILQENGIRALLD